MKLNSVFEWPYQWLLHCPCWWLWAKSLMLCADLSSAISKNISKSNIWNVQCDLDVTNWMKDWTAHWSDDSKCLDNYILYERKWACNKHAKPLQNTTENAMFSSWLMLHKKATMSMSNENLPGSCIVLSSTMLELMMFLKKWSNLRFLEKHEPAW